MFIGFMVILSGILIAVFPKLLSLIVASFLIVTGVWIVVISYYYKKMSKHFENPFLDIIVRF